MKTRVISCIVLIVIAVTCMALSYATRILFFAAAAVLCAYELCHNLRKLDIRCADWVLYLYIAGQTVIQLIRSLPAVVNVIWFGFCLYLCFFAGIVDRRVSGKGALATLAGLVYPCVLFSFLMLICLSDHWIDSLVLACLATWSCDAFALFGGKRFGKHKLAPAVSPNKTVEGSVCGMAAALVFGVLSWLLLPLIAAPLPLWLCLAVSFVCSVFDQIGDLAESLVKRTIGIKDFSNLIPGHGGMFDRADSLLFAIPCAWFCLWLYF